MTIFTMYELLVVVKAWFGVLYAQYSTRGEVEKPIQHEVKPSALLVSRPHLECYIKHTARTNHAVRILL